MQVNILEVRDDSGLYRVQLNLEARANSRFYRFLLKLLEMHVATGCEGYSVLLAKLYLGFPYIRDLGCGKAVFILLTRCHRAGGWGLRHHVTSLKHKTADTKPARCSNGHRTTRFSGLGEEIANIGPNVEFTRAQVASQVVSVWQNTLGGQQQQLDFF